MIKVGIFLLNHCLESCVQGWREIASAVNRIRQEHGLPALLDIVTVSPERVPVKSSLGTTIVPMKDLNGATLDWLFVPVFSGAKVDEIAASEASRYIKEKFDSGVNVASACAGVFYLAAAGILGNGPATTHWGLSPDFHRLFPQIVLRKTEIVVDLGRIVTAAGVTAYQDLMYHLVVRWAGRSVADEWANLWLFDTGRTRQSPYFGWRAIEQGDKDIFLATQWLESNFRHEVNLTEWADAAGLEVRTFLRRFKKNVGQSPHSYLQERRLLEARYLLQESTASWEEITILCGYQDPGTFRRLFSKEMGISPKQMRGFST